MYKIMDIMDLMLSIIAVISALIMVIGFARMCKGKSEKLFAISAIVVAVCEFWNVFVR